MRLGIAAGSGRSLAVTSWPAALVPCVSLRAEGHMSRPQPPMLAIWGAAETSLAILSLHDAVLWDMLDELKVNVNLGLHMLTATGLAWEM